MPAGIVTTGTLPKALWPGLNRWWGMYTEHPMEAEFMVDWSTSNKNYEEDVLEVGLGLAPVKPEGTAVVYDAPSQGFVTRYTHVVYGLGYILTREEIEDNLYPELSGNRTKHLAFAMRQTKEIVTANVYNRATTAAYTGGDGVVLLSASHPTISGNQSNILSPAADLSETSLESMCIQIQQATNDRGHNIALMPQVLIVGPSLWFEANRILKSTLQNDTANNAINVLSATGAIPGGVKVNHYLTDTDAWYLRTNAPNGLRGFNRRGMEFADDNDFDTDNLKYKATMRFSVGWTDWRGLYGSIGA